MAGIGFELRKIYGRKTLASNIWGSLYATMTAVGPSVLVAVMLIFLKIVMDRADITEQENRFFISSFTYVFLISILISALFSTVLSRYISDCVFMRAEKAICASVFGVLTVGSGVSGVIMLALCIAMRVYSGISVSFLVVYYCLGVLVTDAYNLMTYVSALKQYKEVTFSYFLGMLLAAGIYAFTVYVLDMHAVTAAYLSLTGGYFLLVLLLAFWCVRAFGEPEGSYFAFLRYFARFPRLLASGGCYMLGFYTGGRKN